MSKPLLSPLVRLDIDAERRHLEPRMMPLDTGYCAQVVAQDPAGKSRVVHDSVRAFRDRGLFPNEEAARTYAQNWIEGRLAQMQRIEQLRIDRQARLADRLEANLLEQQRLEGQIESLKTDAKRDRQRIEKLRLEAAALVHEAASPQVELDFGPGYDEARVVDAPSVTEGTAEGDPRQRQLDLKPPEPEPESKSSKRQAPPRSKAGAAESKAAKPAKLEPVKPERILVGKMVRRKSNGRIGEVVDRKPGRIRVQFGGRFVWCKPPELELVTGPTREPDDDVVPPDDADRGIDPGRIHWPDEGSDATADAVRE